jgi:hypothetical protein
LVCNCVPKLSHSCWNLLVFHLVLESIMPSCIQHTNITAHKIFRFCGMSGCLCYCVLKISANIAVFIIWFSLIIVCTSIMTYITTVFDEGCKTKFWESKGYRLW